MISHSSNQAFKIYADGSRMDDDKLCSKEISTKRNSDFSSNFNVKLKTIHLILKKVLQYSLHLIHTNSKNSIHFLTDYNSLQDKMLRILQFWN